MHFVAGNVLLTFFKHVKTAMLSNHIFYHGVNLDVWGMEKEIIVFIAQSWI